MVKRKREWIREPARVLMFQVARVDFDTVRKQPVKNNASFAFDETLYIDQFLEKNRAEVMRLDQQNADYDTELRSIDFQLSQFTSFGPQKVDLLSALSTVTYFLSQQTNYKDTGSKLHDKKLAKISKSSFAEGYDALTVKYDALIKRRAEVLVNKQALYNGLKRTAYKLKGVILHDGDNNYGHYYAYIKNNNRYWQFNDRLVTEADRQRVFDDALGLLYENRNVYCLIYTDETLDTDLQIGQGQLPITLTRFVQEKNKELRASELESRLDDTVAQMQIRERSILHNTSYAEFRKTLQRVDSFELYCLDTLNGGVPSPSAFMDALRVNILDELLRSLDLSYFTLNGNIEAYKSLEKALIKYRIDLPEPNEPVARSIGRIKREYVEHVRTVVLLGTALQSLMPSGIREYCLLYAYYFMTQQKNTSAFNQDAYRAFKLNTLYLILQAGIVRKSKLAMLDLSTFAFCIRVCVQTLVDYKQLDAVPADPINGYIEHLLIDMEGMKEEILGWDQVLRAAHDYNARANGVQPVSPKGIPASEFLHVN